LEVRSSSHSFAGKQSLPLALSALEKVDPVLHHHGAVPGKGHGSKPRSLYFAEGNCGAWGHEIKKAKAGEEPYSKADGGGLHLWVAPAGGKLWRRSCRFGGKEKLIPFGNL